MTRERANPSGGPQTLFFSVRAAHIATRYESRFGRGYLAHGGNRVVRRGDPRRIIFGANENKIVVHNLAPNAAEAFAHKLQFLNFVVNENDVAFAAFADLERLPGAD